MEGQSGPKPKQATRDPPPSTPSLGPRTQNTGLPSSAYGGLSDPKRTASPELKRTPRSAPERKELTSAG